ncbi:hypothetical protein [uncultured Bacteroides sp.]|uniref:hypothetical protein n=1 Tax=uncultured Bacteroides sp. TaxID=162156 RepID=UPI0023C1F660|nr:hypothetical protein [uncultured Bacteroides sp.]MDE5700989.1 hypothetical protein [Bacteroides sp.]
MFENTYNLANEVERAQAIANNTDIINGPNFIDPLNQDNVEARDYRFRPNLTMLNQGKNDHYIKEVLNDGAEDGTSTEIPDEEKALGNKARVVDSRIDIGAYEYEAELQPIVYVKANVVGNTDGKSWTTALTDLQAACQVDGCGRTTTLCPPFGQPLLPALCRRHRRQLVHRCIRTRKRYLHPCPPRRMRHLRL